MNPAQERLRVSVVVPVYNRADITAQFLYSFHNHCQGSYELVIVDDGSTDSTPQLLTIWEPQGVTVVRNETNLGFPKTCNRGVSVARYDTIVLVNNDVLIHADFAFVLGKRVQDFPGRLFGAQMFRHNTGWNTFGGQTIPYLAGWCLGFSRSLWECLGGLDERYSPYDVEDMDLSYTAAQAGIPLEQVYVPLDHISGQSFTSSHARRAVTEANIEKFRQKWGLPHRT